MTNDTCGHPTQGGDGPPCQNPASHGDSCYIPAHGGDGDPGGREWSISTDDHDDILDAARNGLSKSGCARAAGVDKASLLRYLEAAEHDTFRTAFARARAKGEEKLARRGLYDDDTDSSMAKFLLSTSFDYIKTEKREMEHSGSGIVINMDDE